MSERGVGPARGRRPRRHPARAVVVVAVALLAACQAAAPTTTAVDLRGSHGSVAYFGPGPDGGAVVVGPDTVVSIAGPGGQVTVTSLREPEYPGGGPSFAVTADLRGTVWQIARNGSPSTVEGGPHPVVDAVAAVETGPPPKGVGAQFRPDPQGVAVLDEQTVVVAAASHGRSTTTSAHRDDSMVLLVSSTGTRRLAGRPGDGTSQRLTDVGVGRSAAGTGTSLDLIHDIVPLTSTSVLLLVTRPLPDPYDRLNALLDAALLDLTDGRLTRLGLPALCEADATGVRVDDHHALVRASKATTGRCDPTGTVQWVEVDTSTATSTTRGSGPGPAFLSGDRLVSLALHPPVTSDTLTVTWAPRP